MRDRNELLFSFKSPLSMTETRDALIQATLNKTAQPVGNGVVTMEYEAVPPLEAGIYFSTVKEDRIVVTAGNRVETFWQIVMTLQRDPRGGVVGEARLDRRVKDVRQWMGNVQELAFLFGDLHRRYSFKILKRKY